MMVPVGRLILFRGVKREELLQATTWLTMPALIGPLMGPPLGGFLTDTLSWRSIFWVNVPVGMVGLLLTWRLLPAVARRTSCAARRARHDVDRRVADAVHDRHRMRRTRRVAAVCCRPHAWPRAC